MTIHSVTRKVVAGQMSAQRKPTVSIVIPVFNSAGCLPSLIESLENELPLISSDYEVLLVNDGSIDASWNVILNLSAKHAWIRGINLMRNYGQHNALLCGIRAAQNELTITMDDDQQNPPSELHKLVDKLMSENLDVVYGRPHKEEHGVFRDTASVLTKLVIKQTLGANNAPDVSAFRIFRTNIRNAFANYSSPAVNIDVLLTWGTSKFGTVVVTHRPREYQTSNYTLRKLIAHAVNMLTGFSTLPLQLASLNGLFLIAVGIVLLTYVLFSVRNLGCNGSRVCLSSLYNHHFFWSPVDGTRNYRRICGPDLRKNNGSPGISDWGSITGHI